LEVQNVRHLDSGSAVQVFVLRRHKPIAFRELRVNDQIRIPQLRLFDDETEESFGVVSLERAKELAIERELDLVEVAPQAQPPVCRLMDYGRFKFEALKRDKESRKEHTVVHVKEMKLRPKISDHDFQTKLGYVRQFLKAGNKVKITITFRGREMVHQEFGRRLLDRMATELAETAVIERSPLVEGRNMIMIMSPAGKRQSKPSENGSAPNGRVAPAAPSVPTPELQPVLAAEGPSPATTTQVEAPEKPTTTTKKPAASKAKTSSSTKAATKTKGATDAKDSKPQGNKETVPGN
jgi:translation initiation factor IF-3